MALRDRRSSMEVPRGEAAIVAPLDEAAHVEDERGRPVAEDRRTAEEGRAVAAGVGADGVELFDHDLLLAGHLVHEEGGATLAHLEDDDLRPGFVARGRGEAHELAEAEQRKD